MSTASRALFGLACALFACGVLSAATGTPISDDPRQQIAQWSNESGQLRGYPASDDGEGDEDDLVYDDVSFAQDSAAAESDELSGNPEFPPSLVFNSEKNRIHKRLPTLGEDYQLPENKMIEIAEGA